jgi:hypothetical protein
MKLYAWQPKGHGELSWFVVAESEAAACEKVWLEIQRRSTLEFVSQGRIDKYDYDGFGTDYYELTVVEAGVVLTNNND